MMIDPKEHGIFPGREIGAELNRLLASLKSDEKKELVLEKGVYYIDADKCPTRIFHVTNTTNEKEYDDPGQRGVRRVAVLLENVRDLIFDGNGSTFIVDGVCDNIDLIGCENVTIKGLEIKPLRPNAHKIAVERRLLTKLTLLTDPDDTVAQENGDVFFVGKDYKFPLTYKYDQRYFNCADPDRPTYFTRAPHPLYGARKIRYADGKITASGFFAGKRFKPGTEYFLFDNSRKNVGVFAQSCKNLTITDFTQRFSYSLSVVCQDCENLTFERLNMSPENVKKFGICSLSDFIHLCCCRGQVIVRDSYFSSSGDDVLNVHGVHFKITSIKGKEITVRFCHSDAYGYNVFHPGDKLAVIEKCSLLELGQNSVESAEMLDPHTIKLTLGSEMSTSYLGQFIENVSACPDVLFEKNRFERISTRGILLTTRGKVVVRDNDFIFTKMWSVEIADDAMDWYESGMVCDVTIENNRFIECTQENIHVFPHNLLHKGYVHNNITIKNNEFHLKKRYCYIFRSAGNIRLIGNKYVAPKGFRRYMLKFTSDVVEKDF